MTHRNKVKDYIELSILSQIKLLEKCVTLSRKILQRRTPNDKRESRPIFRIL